MRDGSPLYKFFTLRNARGRSQSGRVAHPQTLNPQAWSTTVEQPHAQPHLVRLAIEPTGEGPFVEAMREWIENVELAPKRAPLHLVR